MCMYCAFGILNVITYKIYMSNDMMSIVLHIYLSCFIRVQVFTSKKKKEKRKKGNRILTKVKF